MSLQRKRLAERIAQPTPQEVRAARFKAGLNQTQAAQLISTALAKPYHSWHPYELPLGTKYARPIPLAVWELFVLMTDQHPMFSLMENQAGHGKSTAIGRIPLPDTTPDQLSLL